MDQKMTVQLMAQKASGVQAIVSEIASFDEAVAYTRALMVKQGHRTLAVPGLDFAKRACLEAGCRADGVTLLVGPLADHAAGIHVAFTLVDRGIAETGTLILRSDSEDIRLATMLAEVHVAVLEQAHILPDMEAAEPYLNAILMDASPSYTALITGASRTADIERVLAIGVHGPQELHILIHTGGVS